MRMQIGYARISTHEQSLALQEDALRQAGCRRIYTDTCSGSVPSAARPGLAEALAYLRRGDTLVVWRLDRLGRSLSDLVTRIESLHAAGISFRSLTEHLETETPAGRMLLHVVAALTEFERNLIRERTLAGLAAARARGRKGGRRRTFLPAHADQAARMMRNPEMTVSEVARLMGVSRSTLYKYITPAGQVRRPPVSEA